MQDLPAADPSEENPEQDEDDMVDVAKAQEPLCRIGRNNAKTVQVEGYRIPQQILAYLTKTKNITVLNIYTTVREFVVLVLPGARPTPVSQGVL